MTMTPRTRSFGLGLQCTALSPRPGSSNDKSLVGSKEGVVLRRPSQTHLQAGGGVGGGSTPHRIDNVLRSQVVSQAPITPPMYPYPPSSTTAARQARLRKGHRGFSLSEEAFKATMAMARPLQQ